MGSMFLPPAWWVEGVREHPVLSLLQIYTYSRPGVTWRPEELELSARRALDNLNLRSNKLQGSKYWERTSGTRHTYTVSSIVELTGSYRQGSPMQ